MKIESAAARILEPVSELLHRRLELVENIFPPNRDAVPLRLPVAEAAVVAADGRPLSESERHLIQELFELIQHTHDTEERYRELEQRMVALQRENVDLSVRNRQLTEASSRDMLTGLYNRWFVLEKIDSEINRALRHGSPMSLLMLDLDHFKRVNDTWGHPAGDQVLRGIGQLLRESCRVYDVAGRYGGEEFCILLPETKPDNTNVVAERIRRRLEITELPCADTAIVVTASIGIAGLEAPASGDVLSAASLIDRADRALYSAKSRGRNRIEMWDTDVLTNLEAATGH